MEQVAGYILAGGQNKRMKGQKKLFLTYKGETFLQRIRKAMEGLSVIYLSVEDSKPYGETGLPLIEDRYPAIGPIGGICTGLCSCPESALLVAACDMPLLNAETVALLCDTYQREKKTVITFANGRLHPLLGIYTKENLPVLKEMIKEGNYKMMAFLDRIDYIEMDIGREETAVMNINSLEDYKVLNNGKQMLSVEEAVASLIQKISPIEETEKILLLDGLGKVLAEDAVSPMDQPPFPRSPLDGYAIKGEDSKNASRENPVRLQVTGEVCAGQVFDGTVHTGEAVRIMTGAPIPDGADTIIKQENTDYGMSEVQIYESLLPYSNYCYQGEDFQTGDVLLKKGTRLDGIALGILASMGVWEATVYRQPRIGIISTGDELLPPGSKWKPGKIYDSNLYLLGSRLKELGIEPVFLLHCSDDAEKMTELIREKAKNLDMLVTTGGVSVGKKDIMHEVVQKLPAEKLFWKVALKPGSPTLAACYENTLLICLSGNPFGSEANFELLVRPVIGAFMRDKSLVMKKKKASFQGVFSKKSMGRRFLRGYYEDGKVWIPKNKHASGILSTMAGCNCLIDIEKGNQGLAEGDEVWVHLL